MLAPLSLTALQFSAAMEGYGALALTAATLTLGALQETRGHPLQETRGSPLEETRGRPLPEHEKMDEDL